jgi:hypothetical protein
MRSGARQPDSHAVIDEELGVAWTTHISRKIWKCWFCNHGPTPKWSPEYGEWVLPYVICHGANFERVCVDCFDDLINPDDLFGLGYKGMTERQRDAYDSRLRPDVYRRRIEEQQAAVMQAFLDDSPFRPR